MVKEISLIIPSHNDKKKLLQLLNSISNWEIMPNEILIIDSSIKEPSLSSDLLKYFSKNLFYESLKKYNFGNYKLISNKRNYKTDEENRLD